MGKVYKVSETKTNYNIENVTFTSWQSYNRDAYGLNIYSILSQNGNKLFIGSDKKIYELKNNQLTEYGNLSNYLSFSSSSNYVQYKNCIITAYFQLTTWVLVYSLNYGKTWNRKTLTSLNVSSQYNNDYADFGGVAYLNGAIGILLNGTWIYTSDFTTVNYYSVGTSTPIAINKIDDNVVLDTGRSIQIINNFSAQGIIAEKTFSSIALTPYGFGSVKYNAIFLYDNNQYYDLLLYENGQLQDYGTGECSVGGVVYSKNNIFMFCKNRKLYICAENGIKTINIDDTTDVHNYNFTLSGDSSLLPYSQVFDNYIYFYVSYYNVSSGTMKDVCIYDLNKMDFFLYYKSENVSSNIIDIYTVNGTNKFYIYMVDGFTKTEAMPIPPADRTTIYANDYSTIMGSQVLENAVRSVNHKTNTISIENNGLLSQKLLECDKVSLFDSAYNYRKQNYDIKQIFTQTFNVKLILDKPMVDNINNYTFELSYKNQKLYYNALADGHLENIILLASPQTRVMSDTSIKNYYHIDYVEDSTYLTDSIGEPHTEFVNQVTNIVKIDDYTITATVNAIIEYGHYKSGQVGVSNDVIDVKSAREITLSVKGKVMKETYSDFVFSIDLDGNNNPIQNNPLTRTDNELFSLVDTFFQTQANAIIQDNKDGRMVLTVNSTSDLGLYIGKELTVTLKDGTLVNNGATFEVVGIKEKFTGINWKQTYTLKEKKISV